MSKQAFIDKITPYALEVQEKYGVPASLVIAQAALESGWGEKAANNNYFGIKAGKGWKGESATVSTHEVIDGQRIGIKDSFRSYSGLKESVLNYGKFLAENARYKGVQLAENAYEAADAVHRAGYATDPKYAALLKDIIRKNDLTRYDDMKFQGYTDNDDLFASFLKTLISALTGAIASALGISVDAKGADQTSIETPKITGSKVAAVAKTKALS